MPGPCEITGCTRPARSGSNPWCDMHYKRAWRHGSPDIAQRFVGDRVAAFWSKVDRRDDDECWPWTGNPNNGGYGTFWDGTAKTTAHRHSLILAGVDVPDEHDVDHLCHDPATCNGGPTCPHRMCVNPAHLAPATRADNLGRGMGRWGVRHTSS